MADTKISALTSATTPLAGTEVFPLVQSGATVKTPVSSVLDQSGTEAKIKSLTVSGAIAAIVASSIQVDIFNGVSRIFAIGANTGTAGKLKLIAASSDASVYFEVIEVKANGDASIPTGNLIIGTAGKGVSLPGGITWTSGAGSPEGVVTAPVGSLYSRTDGGVLTSLYVKQSGTGNTGWAGK